MAKTTVDTLLVKIEADMGNLKRELNKVSKQVSNTEKKTKKAFAGIGLNFKTLITGAVGLGTISVTRNLIQVASAAEEMRGKASVVFGDFHKDFQEFAKTTAEATGRSAVDIEAMGASIQDLFVPLGFTRQEGTELSKTLSQLAIDVGSFNNEVDTNVMKAFQSALIGNHETVRRFGIVIDQASLKQELFRMGITQNIDEVDKATKVQARLNLILAGTVDAQGDAVRTSGSFANQNMALQGAIKDLSVEMGTELLPAMTKLVRLTREEGIPAFRGFLELIGFLDTPIHKQISKLSEEMGALENKFAGRSAIGKFFLGAIDFNQYEKLSEEMLKLKQIMAETNNAELANVKTKAENVKTTTELTLAQQKLKDEQQAFVDGILLETSQLQQLIEAQKLGDEQYENQILLQERLLEVKEAGLKVGTLEHDLALEMLRLRDEEIKTLEKLQDTQKKEDDALKEATSIVDSYKSEQQLLNEKLERFQELLKETGEQDVPFATETIEKMKEEIRQLDPVVKILEENFERAFDGIAQSIADSMTEGKDAMESFKDVARNILNSLIRDFVRLQLEAIKFQPYNTSGGGSFLGSIFGGFGSLFGGGGQSGITSTGGVSGNFGTFNTGGTSSFMMGRAGGGRIAPDMPTLVGERGAELFVPNTSGRIVPKSGISNALGGSSTIVNQTINVSAGVAQTIRAEMMNMLPSFKQETIAAVAESRLRGGEFASAFTGA